MGAIEAILPRASDLGDLALEQYCVDTLEYDRGSQQSQDLLKGHKTYQMLSKSPAKAQEAASLQVSTASGNSLMDIRNHSLRFNLPNSKSPSNSTEEQKGEVQATTGGEAGSAVKPKRRLTNYFSERISEVFGSSSSSGDRQTSQPVDPRRVGAFF